MWSSTTTNTYEIYYILLLWTPDVHALSKFRYLCDMYVSIEMFKPKSDWNTGLTYVILAQH